MISVATASLGDSDQSEYTIVMRLDLQECTIVRAMSNRVSICIVQVHDIHLHNEQGSRPRLQIVFEPCESVKIDYTTL